MRYEIRQAATAALAVCLFGCGTTRNTDTQRTATEQLLISNAIDRALTQVDFSHLKGRSVFLDGQYLEGAVDRGYLISSLRQHLLASGCVLQEDRAKARYVVEVRSGGIGTDRHSLLVGVPQMTVPSFVPGQPSQIPEIPLAKKNDGIGVAKVGLFAYNRETGKRVWQSGIIETTSRAKDLWVFGLGPFREGTILRGTEFAGQELPVLGERDSPEHEPKVVVPFETGARWMEPEKTAIESLHPVVKVLAELALGGKPMPPEAVRAAQESVRKKESAQKPKPIVVTPTLPASPPAAANTGGHAESAPSTMKVTGLGNISGS